MWSGKTVADVPALFDFLKIYRDRPDDVVFFIGAGLSMPLFPSWTAALNELVAQASKRFGYSTDRQDNLKMMLREGKFSDAADACARDLGENNYRLFIEQNFDREFFPEEIPDAYSALLDLRPQTVLTTNYDRIPEVGGRGGYRNFYQYKNLRSRQRNPERARARSARSQVSRQRVTDPLPSALSNGIYSMTN